MRPHHEELTAAPLIVPALAVLMPLVGTLWMRIRTGGKKTGN